LPRQSQARGSGDKGAGISGCNAGPTRVKRRRHGRCRSGGVRSNLQSPRFRTVEGTPAFGKASPFAGRCRNAGLGRFMRTVGASSPPNEESTTFHQGCSRSSSEEGSLRPSRTAAAGGLREGPSLRVTRPVQLSAFVQRPSPQVVVGSRRRPQATLRLSEGFWDPVFQRFCSAERPVSEELSRFAAFAILLREGKVVGP